MYNHVPGVLYIKKQRSSAGGLLRRAPGAEAPAESVLTIYKSGQVVSNAETFDRLAPSLSR